MTQDKNEMNQDKKNAGQNNMSGNASRSQHDTHLDAKKVADDSSKKDHAKHEDHDDAKKQHATDVKTHPAEQGNLRK